MKTKSKTKIVPNSFKIIGAGLKVAAKQAIESDVKALAAITGKHENTINMYLKGDVRDFTTGSIILTELKRLVDDREKLAMQLVA